MTFFFYEALLLRQFYCCRLKNSTLYARAEWLFSLFPGFIDSNPPLANECPRKNGGGGEESLTDIKRKRKEHYNVFKTIIFLTCMIRVSSRRWGTSDIPRSQEERVGIHDLLYLDGRHHDFLVLTIWTSGSCSTRISHRLHQSQFTYFICYDVQGSVE